MRRRNKHQPRSGCPISTSLESLGDRWTLVIVRDMISGKRKFSEFLDSPEEITTSVLSVRLAMMENEGLVKSSPYQSRPTRYEYILTKKGAALLPVLQEISKWANRFMPETWPPPEDFMNRTVD